MNKQDRKELQTIITELSSVQDFIVEAQAQINYANDFLDRIYASVDTLADSEQDKYDNLPEGLQDSDRGQTLYDNAEKLDSIRDCIDSLRDTLADMFDEEDSLCNDIAESIQELL